jgi:hypothetical protein
MTLNPVSYQITVLCEVRYPVLVKAFSNPKLEARSTKQYPMSQIRINQTIIPITHGCLVLVIGTFEFRICFEFRYSDFEFPAAARAD